MFVLLAPTTFKNSMSPVKSELFVPPRVNTPPNSSALGSCVGVKRVKKNDISGSAKRPAFTSSSQKGVVWDWEIAWNARPRMPASPESNRSLVISVATMNVCGTTLNPAMDTVSCTTIPAMDPLPYWICISSCDTCLIVEDFDGSKTGKPAHDLQSVEVNHRSDEPVSRTTFNVCGGVPTEMGAT